VIYHPNANLNPGDHQDLDEADLGGNLTWEAPSAIANLVPPGEIDRGCSGRHAGLMWVLDIPLGMINDSDLLSFF